MRQTRYAVLTLALVLSAGAAMAAESGYFSSVPDAWEKKSTPRPEGELFVNMKTNVGVVVGFIDAEGKTPMEMAKHLTRELLRVTKHDVIVEPKEAGNHVTFTIKAIVERPEDSPYMQKNFFAHPSGRILEVSVVGRTAELLVAEQEMLDEFMASPKF